MGTITVTKLDAARRQLRTAIQLWFDDDDPIAIHALVYAAHEIIHRLYRKRELRGLIFDSPIVRKGSEKAVADQIKSVANFIKHADRGRAETSIEFEPFLNVVLMMTSLTALYRMKQTIETEEAALGYWLLFNYPDVFAWDMGEKRIPIDLIEDATRIGKHKFLEAFKLVWREGRFI